MNLGPTDHDDTSRTCRCKDPDLDRLRDLIAAGVPQQEASRIIWSPQEPPTSTSSPIVAAYVRARLVAAFPWLRLPRKVA